MSKKDCVAFVLVLMSLLVHTQVFAAVNINGLWKHTAKPVVLKLDLCSGLLRVESHNDNTKANGLTVIKNIRPTQQLPPHWTGEMYNGYIDKYVTVNLSLENKQTLLVHDLDNHEVLKLVRE